MILAVEAPVISAGGSRSPRTARISSSSGFVPARSGWSILCRSGGESGDGPSVFAFRNLFECQLAPVAPSRPRVADDTGHDEIGVVESGAEGVCDRIAELAALVNRSRYLGRDMLGYPARERELTEEPAMPVLVG